MWLVLCETNDYSAIWAAEGLRLKGLQPLEIVTAESITYSRHFIHRPINNNSSVSIKLADGRVIDGASVSGTLNRLQAIPLEHIQGANSNDRNYAEQELYALFLSWLYSLPGPMLNRPTPQGLSGAWRHPSEWFWLAAQVGFYHLPYSQSDIKYSSAGFNHLHPVRNTIIVVNETCCGPPAPQSIHEKCIKLAKLSRTSLLGINFHITKESKWVFTDATPLPDLRLGGGDLLFSLSKEMLS